ncbi:MAG: SMI1/KNR4 family protein, partial [Nitrospiraceae bacterium]|nr:SMI1/KNR4 family protein [Nitrospiraceae bacterium]
HHPLDLRAALAEGSAGNASTGTDASPDEIRVLSEPVTLQSFFAGIHYTHARYDEPDRTYNGTPNADSAGSAEKIAAAEARLGIAMPEALRAVYLTQNGGSINRLCVPKAEIAEPRRYDDVVMPFSGYDDLLPCETLRTVFDSTTDFADPDDPEQSETFPEDGHQLVILAQWYRQTLFLDYSAGGEPRVGFVDFDHADWRAHALRWPTFDAFFAALRHYEDARSY